jgi:hypothetical protein
MCIRHEILYAGAGRGRDDEVLAGVTNLLGT